MKNVCVKALSQLKIKILMKRKLQKCHKHLKILSFILRALQIGKSIQLTFCSLLLFYIILIRNVR